MSSLFKLFRKKQDMDPLVELPQANEPIELDDEEQTAMRSHWPSTLTVDVDGDVISTEDGSVVFEGSQAEIFRRGMGAGGLDNLARRKFESGDLKGAASTSVKALALFSDDYDAWFLLAELNAASGDFDRARRVLDQAERSAKAIGIRHDSPLWKPRVDQLRAQIRGRQYSGVPSAGELGIDYLQKNKDREQ